MFKRINKEEAQLLLANNNSILVDIRDDDSYREGHLSQALHLKQDNLATFVDQTPKDTLVMVMCYHGNSSQAVAQYLTTQGFESVYSIDGGYEGWVTD